MTAKWQLTIFYSKHVDDAVFISWLGRLHTSVFQKSNSDYYIPSLDMW